MKQPTKLIKTSLIPFYESKAVKHAHVKIPIGARVDKPPQRVFIDGSLNEYRISTNEKYTTLIG